jgi:hypothetical protein
MEVARVKATILYDEHGAILAISKAVDLKAAGSKFSKVGMVPRRGQRLIEAELSREDAARPLRDLHTAYRVDPATSKLVKAGR